MGRNLFNIGWHTLDYLIFRNGIVGSIPGFNHILRSHPIGTLEGDVVADIQCHTYAEDSSDVGGILRAARKNRVDLLGWTKHVGSDEDDFWVVKDYFDELSEEGDDNGEDSSRFYHEDNGLVSIMSDLDVGNSVGVVGNYEVEVETDGLRDDAYLDVMAFMPDEGIEKWLVNGMGLDDFLDIVEKYNAIPLIAHLCTLPSKGGMPFRSPSEEELDYLLKNVVSKVAGTDEVADAALWMKYSWRQSYNLWEDGAMRSSDAHTRVPGFLGDIPIVGGLLKSYLRNEIGRAYTIFDELGNLRDVEGGELREELRYRIKKLRYRTGGGFTPLGQFTLGTALPNLLS